MATGSPTQEPEDPPPLTRARSRHAEKFYQEMWGHARRHMRQEEQPPSATSGHCLPQKDPLPRHCHVLLQGPADVAP